MSNRGATLIEVLLAVILASTVTLGLTIAFLFGIDSWERTALKSALSESGSSTLFIMERDIQRADSIEILEGGKALFLQIRPFDNTVPQHAIIYKVEDMQLLRDSTGIVTTIIPQHKADSTTLDLIPGKKLFSLNRTLPINEFDRVIDIQFRLKLKNKKIEEATEFQTTVFPRNNIL